MKIYYKYPFLQDLINFILKDESLKKSYDFSYMAQKYCLEDIILSILAIIKNGITRGDFLAIIDDAEREKIIKINYAEKYFFNKNKYKVNIIKGKTVWSHYNKFCKYNIFEKFFNQYLNEFLACNKCNFNFLLADTTFIPNKKGIDNKGRCVQYKSKNGNKVSIILTNDGIPLRISINKGNEHDTTILLEDLKVITKKIYKNEKGITKYFLADGLYDSKKIRNKIKSLKYKAIIDFNKRNTKDKKKLAKKKFTDTQKLIYINRVHIEHFNSHLKGQSKFLDNRYFSKFLNFSSVVFIACIKLISIKWQKNNNKNKVN